MINVRHADCREALAEMESDSVDACVTDPPYHLTSIVDRFGSETAAPAKPGIYARVSRGFMGRTWDAPDRPAIDPGFAHWMAGFIDGEGCFSVHKKTVNNCQTYDCQFTITLRADDRDILVEMQRQLGGIGTLAQRQPKQANAGPQVRYCISSKGHCCRLRDVLTVFPLRAKKRRDFEVWSLALDEWLSHEPGGSWEEMAYFRDHLMMLKRYGSGYHPSQLFHYQWAREVFRVLKPGAHLIAFGGTRTYHRLVCAIEDAGFEIRDQIAWLFGSGFPKSHNLDGAWEGWGTALKPAHEPICLARKAVVGTVAANVLQHGTGALHIDGCRVEGSWERNSATRSDIRGGALVGGKSGGLPCEPQAAHNLGRWPANVIHDGSPEVLAGFPESNGQQGAVTGNEPTANGFSGPVAFSGLKARIGGYEPRLDSGSAARFFYTAKADADDRLGSKHPTVKPVDLMAYLVRLVTPPGGVVLDPFAGSGTTGMACMREGFDAILIEREAEYVADIKRRIAHVRGEDAPLFAGAEP